MKIHQQITVTGASENNLRTVNLTIPKNKLVVVTGVSGSGKSTLAFDVIYREAERRYVGSFSSFARQFMARMHKPDVEQIDGLSPAIALDQKSTVSNPRSTVGTMTGVYDLLRLLFARTGKQENTVRQIKLSRSLFSFNAAEGACPACKGLGVEDFLDPDLIIADENRSLRQGALVITAPNGYIIYSQVTLDVLDQVCRTEGFHTDIPWKDLTPEQKNIIWYGSDKIEIPFGKHPLESRMKWTGITAKPREMGYYKGILPIMEDILRRDRNKNILRFVRSIPCRKCRGTRLNEDALSVRVGDFTIAELSDLELNELAKILSAIPFQGKDQAIAGAVINAISRTTGILTGLGLGYLSCSRESTTLTGGESQRLRLASLAGIELSNMIMILDEPTAGLHPHDTEQLVSILKQIRDKGNSVIVVEHDEWVMRHADWLIDIGPGPGKQGGEVLFCGSPGEIPGLPREIILRSPTLTMLTNAESADSQSSMRVVSQNEQEARYLNISGACVNNLQHIDVTFRLNALNVVTGVSGAGKSSLTIQVLGDFMQHHLEGKLQLNKTYQSISGFESIRKLIVIDQSPIGRTPRSNPATYTGVFDLIRDLFARQPEAVRLGFDKSRFSFNTEGGRCESCQGAGYQQLGMHFLGSVEVPCEVCEGKRFDESTLSILWNDKSISDILDMTVEEAIVFFRGLPGIVQFLDALTILGLGYLTLGQRSSTLSGGEAQRVKLATELARPSASHTLYIMDEPTTGLHAADVKQLMKALEKLAEKGHTIVVMEHHPDLIRQAAHIIDLGPGSGKNGGNVVFSGTWTELLQCENSLTGKALKPQPSLTQKQSFQAVETDNEKQNSIVFKGVATHNLKNTDISIPHGKLTVVTGVSGSGKSSLIFDTLHATAQNRYLDGFSAWVRARMSLPEAGVFESVEGLTPTLAISQRNTTRNPRSTVGTLSGIYDLIRLLFARCGTHISSATIQRPHSGIFSFNHHAGACPICKGLGTITRCDPEKLITHPGRSLSEGAMDGTKTGRFYGDPYGQYMATLQVAGIQHGIEFSIPWDELSEKAKAIALYGTGDQEYDVTWEYRRGKREGQHHFKGTWQGLKGLVEAEYQRKHADYRGEEMIALMTETLCEACRGSRLCSEALQWQVAGADIAAVVDLQSDSAIPFFTGVNDTLQEPALKEAAKLVCDEITSRLQILTGLGLCYLTLARSIDSLSDGEERRVRLAAILTSGLTGITCILDEPTTGLHPKDIKNLMAHLRLLQERGNTVVIVEHDMEVIRMADHVIDLGPGAGIHGGQVVFSGSPTDMVNYSGSVTAKYIGSTVVPEPIHANPSLPGIHLRGISRHNLKGFDLTLQGSGLLVVTGVSGSGKSTLVFDVIHRSWLESKPSGCLNIDGFQSYNQVVAGTISGRGTSGLSVVATRCGIFDAIRAVLAAQPVAMEQKMGKNHFSFLNKEGQCIACEGRGEIRTSMDFLPDLVSTCEACNGNCYNDEVLKIRYKGKNIAEMLSLPVSEATGFFRDEKKIQPAVNLLNDIGLGYLTLGQEVSTLSGGEFQRLDLVVSLLTPAKGRTLWLFDEPSAGLHPHDVGMLLKVFRRLVERGDTVLVTEHDPMIIAAAGFQVELGPSGGDAGGFLIRAGFQ